MTIHPKHDNNMSTGPVVSVLLKAGWLQYGVLALALPAAPPMSHWYANSCPTMTVHIQARGHASLWGHLNFKGPNWTAGCVHAAWECMCAVKAFSSKSTHKSHTFRTKGPKDIYFLVDETLFTQLLLYPLQSFMRSFQRLRNFWSTKDNFSLIRLHSI